MNKSNGIKDKIILLLIVCFQIIISWKYLNEMLPYEEYKTIQFSLITLLMPSPLEDKKDDK